MTQQVSLLRAFHDAPSQVSAPVSRVLVVDDDDGIAGLLMARVDERGLAVDHARHGQEAMAYLRESPPDLVLLDVELPGSSGLDVLAEIRQRKLDMAVIMTTGYGSEEVAIEALRLGADDYLRKPFELADFDAIIDRTVSRLHLRRQNVALWRHIDEQRRLLDRELARAAQLQAELLPSAYPDLAGFDMAAACLPALEVGGDFYDWQMLPSGTLSLTVGDVMGKGMSAALLMATARAAVRALVGENTPRQVVQRAARALDGDLTRSGSFITLFHAQIEPGTGIVRYVDAGHGYVAVRRKDGTVDELEPWGLPIGVDAREVYEEGSVLLGPGDTLIVYSDGLTEARPDLFSDRSSVAAHAEGIGAAALVKTLIDSATKVTPLPDDLTVVVLHRHAVLGMLVGNYRAEASAA